MRFVPAAEPAGRAFAKLPPPYTVLPTTACDQTTPSICTVGNASAVTVLADGCATGAGSADAAGASATLTANPATTVAAATNDTTRRPEGNATRMKLSPLT